MRVPATVAAVVLIGAAGCVGPSRTRHDYELKAANTAEAAASAVGSAQAAVKAAAGNRVQATYLSVALNEAAKDAGATQATFDSVQPPTDASDALRDELDKTLNEVTTTLDQLRTAVRRGNLDRLAEIAKPLPGLHDRLDAFEKAHA